MYLFIIAVPLSSIDKYPGMSGQARERKKERECKQGSRLLLLLLLSFFVLDDL